MKKTILLLSAIIFFFAGCKKDDVLEASKVEMKDVNLEILKDYVKISGEYSYPQALENIKVYVSKNENMSESKTYLCTLDGRKFVVEMYNLDPQTSYYYRYEYDNGYTLDKSDKQTFKTLEKGNVLATVKTTGISNISTYTAVGGGTVTSAGEYAVTARGVCWSTSQNPTINDSKTTDGTGTGTFTSIITGLNSNTTYYVRAYATNKKGTAYGTLKSFTTLSGGAIPMVTTTAVSNITKTSAIGGGNVSSTGGSNVTAKGVCWSTSQNPTINDNKTINGTGTGAFSSTITGLKSNTTYYVRAYATNENGTAYGAQKSFTTLE